MNQGGEEGLFRRVCVLVAVARARLLTSRK